MLEGDLTPGWKRCLWEALATFPSSYTREVNFCNTSQSSLVAVLPYQHKIACCATIKYHISTTTTPATFDLHTTVATLP